MILVTGSTGIAGHHLVKTLSKQNKYVKALIRSEGDEAYFNELKNVECCVGDILDVSTLSSIMKDVEYVFHTAGIVSFSPFQKEQINKVNVEGTANVVNACLENEVRKLCHLSSIAALGKPKNSNVLDETSEWEESETNSNYGKSKYLAELEVWRGVQEGLDSIIVNPSVLLGGSNWNRSSTRLFKYAYEEHRYYTSKVTDFVDVRDVVNIMLDLTFSDIKNERFVVSANNVSYQKVFSDIAVKFGKVPPKKEASYAMGQIAWRIEHLKSLLSSKEPLLTKETAAIASNDFQYNNAKIKSVLNYKFHSFEETIDWVCGELSKKYHLN